MNTTTADVAGRIARSGVTARRSGEQAIAVASLNSGVSPFRRALSFVGPGYLVAVGYMDPGNWATSLAGGSAFGYSLLSVVLLSNVTAMLLQAAAVRLNLAEVLGMAYGLALLFHIPLPVGVCITAADVFLVLGLQRRGVRQFESLIIAPVALIGACFAVQIWWLQPSAAAVAAGFIPKALHWKTLITCCLRCWASPLPAPSLASPSSPQD